MAAQISDLQERQIINIADGKCWGNIKDVELDVEQGCIKALILPGVSGLWSLLQRQGELYIPWKKVVRIGIDVILIEAEELVEEQQRLYKKSRRNRKLLQEQTKFIEDGQSEILEASLRQYDAVKESKQDISDLLDEG